jgi:hypothetical protein
MEDPARPVLQTRWMDPSALDVTGAAPPGQLMAVQVNADPGWRATQDGREIAITRDTLGFMVLHPSASAAARVELRYHGTIEQRIMALVSVVAWIVSLWALVGALRKRKLRSQAGSVG